MTSPVSPPEDTNKKFVPKRRAPYLLQNEVIKQNITEKIVSINESPKGLNNDEKSAQEKESKPTTLVSTETYQNNEVNKKSNVSQHRFNSRLHYREEVSKLSGIQKRVVGYFVGCCIVKSDSETGPVTMETLCNVINTTKKTLKKIIQRIIEKGFMHRSSGKVGKGGFSVFKFHKEFIDAFKLQLDLENTQTFKNKVSLIEEDEKLKTRVNDNPILPKEWQEIDCTNLEEIGFGFPQIRQIYNKQVNTPEIIQTSINHFAFAIQHKPGTLQKYKNKLATFMSVLQKGGAWVEHDYMSPKDIALAKLVKQRKYRIEKLNQLEEELFSNAFELWTSSLTEEERDEIIPDSVKKAPFAKGIQIDIALKNYFKKYLWKSKMPDELKQIKEDME